MEARRPEVIRVARGPKPAGADEGASARGHAGRIAHGAWRRPSSRMPSGWLRGISQRLWPHVLGQAGTHDHRRLHDARQGQVRTPGSPAHDHLGEGGGTSSGIPRRLQVLDGQNRRRVRDDRQRGSAGLRCSRRHTVGPGTRRSGCLLRTKPVTTEELESRLEARSESQGLEFKAACPWNAELFAKDILALANVQHGGEIIVGVEDASFNRQGLSEQDAATYRADVMRDQMSRFADPHVQFDTAIVSDRGGLRFAVIRVHPFSEVPVLCRVDHAGAGVQAGALYYRTLHRRPESARVSNSYDMRTIVDLAAVRMMQQRRRAGYTVEASAQRALDE